MNVLKEANKKLKETNLTFLEKLYERIYAKHNNRDNLVYLLEGALDIYVHHSQNGNAKNDKNIIRLAAIINVLFNLLHSKNKLVTMTKKNCGCLDASETTSLNWLF